MQDRGKFEQFFPKKKLGLFIKSNHCFKAVWFGSPKIISWERDYEMICKTQLGFDWTFKPIWNVFGPPVFGVWWLGWDSDGGGELTALKLGLMGLRFLSFILAYEPTYFNSTTSSLVGRKNKIVLVFELSIHDICCYPIIHTRCETKI